MKVSTLKSLLLAYLMLGIGFFGGSVWTALRVEEMSREDAAAFPRAESHRSPPQEDSTPRLSIQVRPVSNDTCFYY